MTTVANQIKSPSNKKKKARSSSTVNRTATPKPRSKNNAKSGEPKILVTIHNEHKYMGVLMKILKEQIRNMKQSRDVDYSMMFDIMHYMNNFPDRFHHPREDLILHLMLEKSDELKPVIEQLFEEHILIADKGRKILSDLKSILKEHSETKQARLQAESHDYVRAILEHISLEENVVFKKATQILKPSDWTKISTQSETIEDPIFGQRIEERYKNIYQHLSHQIDKAADDFTLLEFIGIAALFESIGPLMSGTEEVSSILKKSCQQIFSTNMACCKSLLKPSTVSRSDYISKPLGCMLDSYDYYVQSLVEIGQVLRKTKKKITEPYSAGFQLLEEIERDFS